MTWKELEPLPPDQYRELEYQMDQTPDPDTVYTETGRHPELAELLRQFGYLASSRYSAYEIGVKLLEMGDTNMAWKEKKPLTKSQWTILDNLLSDGLDPNCGYSVTGYHYELERLLGSFGYRAIGRHSIWDTAQELWALPPVDDFDNGY